MITLTLLSTTVAGRLRRSLSVLAGCAAAAAAMRRQRRTYHVLSSLDDRTLRDIGLNRTMLLSVSVHGIRSAADAAPSSASNSL